MVGNPCPGYDLLDGEAKHVSVICDGQIHAREQRANVNVVSAPIADGLFPSQPLTRKHREVVEINSLVAIEVGRQVTQTHRRQAAYQNNNSQSHVTSSAKVPYLGIWAKKNFVWRWIMSKQYLQSGIFLTFQALYRAAIKTSFN
jgi:hypothetical protein